MNKPRFLYEIVYVPDYPNNKKETKTKYCTAKVLSKLLRTESVSVISANLMFCSDKNILEIAYAEEKQMFRRKPMLTNESQLVTG